MTIKEIIKKIMADSGVGNATLAGRLGITPAALWDRLNGKNKDIGVGLSMNMLNSLDYQIVVVPRETKIRPEWFLIDKADGGKK